MSSKRKLKYLTRTVCFVIHIKHLIRVRHMRSFTLIFIIFMSFPVFSSPSFDCSLASSVIEKTICKPKNVDLQKLDKKLSVIYRNLRKQKNKAFLKISQRKWLKFLGSTCTNNYIDECLQHQYKSRINELENNLISFRILPSELPYKININNVLIGNVIFKRESRKDKVDGEEVTQSIIIESKTNKDVLWLSKSTNYGTRGQFVELEGLNIYLYDNKNVFFEVLHTETGGGGSSSGLSDTYTSSYTTYSPSKTLQYQGDISQGKTGHYSSNSQSQWSSISGLNLLVSAKSSRYDDYSYISPFDRVSYTFSFERARWQISDDDVIENLENKQKPTSYLNLYNKINTQIQSSPKYKYHNKSYKSCIDNNVDWSKVATGLQYWLTFSILAQKEGFSYKQAYYALPKLIYLNDAYSLSETQVALAIGLNYYRKKLELEPKWEEKLKASISNPEKINIETMIQNGLPKISNKCADEIKLTYSYIKFENWLYSFWARRYKEDTYNLAKLVINHMAGSAK